MFPPKGGCNPVVGLQCAARIGGKQRKGTNHLGIFIGVYLENIYQVPCYTIS